MRAIAAMGVLVALVGAGSAAGVTNPQIAGLQVALRAKGLYAGPVDGVAGPSTAGAVRAFQQRARLTVDGIAGIRTRTALGRLGRPLLGRRVLARGKVGWDVSVLQFLLVLRGCGPVSIDGRFGVRTERAVRRFQEKAGLVVDGIAGPATQVALDPAGARATPQPPAAVRHPTYVVRPGDTLTAIADRYGTTIGAIALANRIDPQRALPVAVRLRVPAALPPPFAVRLALDRWSRHYGVDARLVRALAWQESGYQQHLVSRAGAAGVMQVTPATWGFVETVLVGRKIPRTADGNVRVGVAFLRHLLRRFRGDERLALGAYYQGPRAVRKHGLFGETRAYVANVLALKHRV